MATAAYMRDYWRRNSTRLGATEYRRASCAANGANKRARKYGIPGRLSATDLRKVTGPCFYCGGPSGGWDHFLPMCLGGANAPENIVSCCAHCNRVKGRRHPTQFIAARQRIAA